MGFVPFYLKPPNQQLIEYAKYLYGRREESVYPVRIEVSHSSWSPKPRDCHFNCIDYCELNSDYAPEHGWLYFKLDGQNYVRFVAHSVIRSKDGQLFDITPMGTPTEYPFLSCGLEDDSYSDVLDALEMAHQFSFLDHLLR